MPKMTTAKAHGSTIYHKFIRGGRGEERERDGIGVKAEEQNEVEKKKRRRRRGEWLPLAQLKVRMGKLERWKKLESIQLEKRRKKREKSMSSFAYMFCECGPNENKETSSSCGKVSFFEISRSAP